MATRLHCRIEAKPGMISKIVFTIEGPPKLGGYGQKHPNPQRTRVASASTPRIIGELNGAETKSEDTAKDQDQNEATEEPQTKGGDQQPPTNE
jgi:hypothetical protein